MSEMARCLWQGGVRVGEVCILEGCQSGSSACLAWLSIMQSYCHENICLLYLFCWIVNQDSKCFD